MGDNLLELYEGMLKEAKDEEEIEEGKGKGPGKGEGDQDGDGSGKCAEGDEEEIDEAAVADSAIVSKVQKILKKADKKTLVTIMQWIGKESDKVKI